jgi:hypothetical protein
LDRRKHKEDMRYLSQTILRKVGLKLAKYDLNPISGNIKKILSEINDQAMNDIKGGKENSALSNALSFACIGKAAAEVNNESAFNDSISYLEMLKKIAQEYDHEMLTKFCQGEIQELKETARKGKITSQ